MRQDDALHAAGRYHSLGGDQCERLRTSAAPSSGTLAEPGQYTNRGPPLLGARPRLEAPQRAAGVQCQHAILPRLGPPEGDELAQLVRVMLGQVVARTRLYWGAGGAGTAGTETIGSYSD